jgi:toxin YoeB
LSAKKKDKNRSENSQPEIIIIQRQIIFDEDFREDLQWWYRQNVQKANKILDLSR